MNRLFLFFVTAGLFFFVSLNASAAINSEIPLGFRCADKNLTSFQCGISSVHPGEAQGQVFQQCGPPDAKFFTHRETNPNLETWTYNFGPEDFVYNFMFRNGKLEDIKRIGIGF